MKCVTIIFVLTSILVGIQCFTLRPRALFQNSKMIKDLRSSHDGGRIAVSPLFASSEPPLLTPNKVLFQELESQIKKDQDTDKDIKKSSKFAFESNWVLALHNDMQHTVEEVAELLHKVCL